MASTQPATRPGRTETLERLFREHHQEVARLREEFGDPRLALFAFTRERLEQDSLLEAARRHDEQNHETDR